MASGVCYVSPKIHAADKVDNFTPKIFDAAIINLALVRENICYQRIDQIVEKLTQARHIYFYALGASAIVARDAANKFLSLNLPVSSHDDILIQQMLAAKGRENDVFFITSDAQQNKEMIEVAQTIINNGATLISMTPSENALADISIHTLFVDIFEFSKEHVTVSSRIVHLLILDVLTAGVALCNSQQIHQCKAK